MSFFRTTVFVAALVLAGASHATDISMAGGSVNFNTPDQWVGIMETQGDPEVRVFQVQGDAITERFQPASLAGGEGSLLA